MKPLPGYLLAALIGLLLLAALAPALIALSDALLPPVIVLAIAVVVVRLVFFHTRNW